MTNEQYQEMRAEYIEYVKGFMNEFGNFGPMITVFADVEGEEKPAIIHIPIPPKFMENDESKDEFANEVIPDIFAELKEKFTPIGVAWAAEAWVRSVDKDSDIINYKNAPIKKEVIFISIEDKNGSETIAYDIIRHGKQVTPTGELVDTVELKEDESLKAMDGIAGRFSNLYSRFFD
jgi:hypothetical protein